VNNNVRKDRLEVMPAYFWMYNLYALERNSWKAMNRDKRIIKVQHIETDYLAPDTAEEIIAALGQMETWLEAADRSAEPENNADGEIPAPGLEHNRQAVLLKPRKALAAYREMLRFYAGKTLTAYMDANPGLSFEGLAAEMEGPGSNTERVTEWVNMGGQIVPAFRVDNLRAQIRTGRLDSWKAIHKAYDEFWAAYPLDKARHAWGVLTYLHGKGPANTAAFIKELDHTLETRRWVTDQVYCSRAKDFHDPFRNITYRNKEEMDQVAGKLEDNFFVKLTRERLGQFEETVKLLKERMGLEITNPVSAPQLTRLTII
jgi:hypothetical protein